MGRLEDLDSYELRNRHNFKHRYDIALLFDDKNKEVILPQLDLLNNLKELITRHGFELYCSGQFISHEEYADPSICEEIIGDEREEIVRDIILPNVRMVINYAGLPSPEAELLNSSRFKESTPPIPVVHFLEHPIWERLEDSIRKKDQYLESTEMMIKQASSTQEEYLKEMLKKGKEFETIFKIENEGELKRRLETFRKDYNSKKYQDAYQDAHDDETLAIDRLSSLMFEYKSRFGFSHNPIYLGGHNYNWVIAYEKSKELLHVLDRIIRNYYNRGGRLEDQDFSTLYKANGNTEIFSGKIIYLGEDKFDLKNGLHDLDMRVTSLEESERKRGIRGLLRRIFF